MLKHLNTTETHPERVVIIGSRGFIGSQVCKVLKEKNINVLELSRNELELLNENSVDKLSDLLEGSDTVVMTSALAPCKDSAMLVDNLKMANHVSRALQNQPVAHFVYISSDAVYSDSDQPMAEDSPTCPDNLHGIMHVARETIFSNELSMPVAFVRPTLVYGTNDPHNGYGPNQFNRLAENDEDIVLFGNGEEKRDHVRIEDVAEIIVNVVLMKSEGIVNAVSGELITFHEIAEIVVEAKESSSKVITTERKGAMPHNGYRAFDIQQLKEAFSGFLPMPPTQGLKQLAQG